MLVCWRIMPFAGRLSSKFHSYPRSFGQLFIFRTIFQSRALSSNIPAAWRGLFTKYSTSVIPQFSDFAIYMRTFSFLLNKLLNWKESDSSNTRKLEPLRTFPFRKQEKWKITRHHIESIPKPPTSTPPSHHYTAAGINVIRNRAKAGENESKSTQRSYRSSDFSFFLLFSSPLPTLSRYFPLKEPLRRRDSRLKSIKNIWLCERPCFKIFERW